MTFLSHSLTEWESFLCKALTLPSTSLHIPWQQSPSLVTTSLRWKTLQRTMTQVFKQQSQRRPVGESAVLICLAIGPRLSRTDLTMTTGESSVNSVGIQQDLWFPLLLRPTTMRVHARQVCLPGGRLEPGETPIAAAIREAREEIGLSPQQHCIMGQLSTVFSVPSHTLVTPVVSLYTGTEERCINDFHTKDKHSWRNVSTIESSSSLVDQQELTRRSWPYQNTLPHLPLLSANSTEVDKIVPCGISQLLDSTQTHAICTFDPSRSGSTGIRFSSLHLPSLGVESPAFTLAELTPIPIWGMTATILIELAARMAVVGVGEKPKPFSKQDERIWNINRVGDLTQIPWKNPYAEFLQQENLIQNTFESV